MHIRESTVVDGEALAALLVEMHAHYGRADPKLVWVRVHKAYFPGDGMGSGPLVAVVDGVPVGFAEYNRFRGYSDQPPYFAIQEFFVTAEARGRGIGRALFEAVSARAAERGSRHVVLGNIGPRELSAAELGAVLDGEVYVTPALLPRVPDPEQQERRRQLRDLAARSGWDPPVVIDRRREIFDYSVGDVVAEGDVPFAILADGRAVRAHFRTVWESSHYGDDERTTWRLTLDGRDFHPAVEIDSSWTRGATLPHWTQPSPDGGEGVNYKFFFGHHLATTSGTIEYIFDLSAMRVRIVEHLETDTSP
ncbi:GNAT family N-acetyltransferase [Nocardia sp. NPDC059240]|uniref:GNAT family N-acetyltransferase n=1 Tax=Nocardia sp. NPDC059240 TaxID=3346786 RepID=UPI0036AE3490